MSRCWCARTGIRRSGAWSEEPTRVCKPSRVSEVPRVSGFTREGALWALSGNPERVSGQRSVDRPGLAMVCLLGGHYHTDVNLCWKGVAPQGRNPD